MIRKTAQLCLGVIAVLAMVGAANAESIAIGNHSFETPDLVTDRSQAIGSDTWRRVGDGSDPLGLGAIGLFKRVDGTFASIVDPTPDPADGEQALYLNGAAESIFQVLTDTLEANTTYTLTVDAGDRHGLAFQPCELRMGTVSDPLVSADFGLNLLAATVVSNTTPVNDPVADDPEDGWETWVTTFTVGDGVVGDQLRVELVTTGTIQSIFDNVRLETGGGGEPDLPGDANGNGFVDDLDLAILLGNWEQDELIISTWSLGNFTEGSLGDTDVDDADLAVLLGNWTGPPPGGAAVPEPATLALLGLGGLSVLRRRRRSCLRP